MFNPSHCVGGRKRAARLLMLVAGFVGGSGVMIGLAGPQGGASSAGLIGSAIEQLQANTAEAEALVLEADLLMQERKFGEASANYQRAYGLLPDAPVTARLREEARDKWAESACDYAKDLARGGRLEEARGVLDAVLDDNVHPTHAGTKRWRKRLDDPEWFNPAVTPRHLENVSNVEEHFRLAKGFYDLANFDKAHEHFDEILRIDPTNKAAQRGIEQVENARNQYFASARDRTRASMLSDVNALWETQVPPADAELQRIYADGAGPGGTENFSDLLNTIIFPSILFEAATLEEVVDYMVRRARDIRPGVAMNVVIDISAEDATLRSLPITLQLKEVPMSILLDYVTGQTKTRWRTDEFSVVIEPLTATTQNLVLRNYVIPPGFISNASLEEDGSDDPFASGNDNDTSGLEIRRLSPQEFLSKAGVSFPDGAFANIDQNSGQLVIRNTPDNLSVVESLIAAVRKGGPRNVIIEVKMIEVNHSTLEEKGFDWLLDGFNLPGSDRVFGSGGTVGNSSAPVTGDNALLDYPLFLPGSTTPLGRNPITSGNRSGAFAIEGDGIDAQIQQSNNVQATPARTPGIFGVQGAFTDPQFQVVLRALDQTSGIDTITSPTTITRPGQRASVEVVREFIYPTEYDPPEIPQDFGNVPFGNLVIIGPSDGTIPVTPANPTAFEMRRVGTNLEVEASILPDGYNLELNLTPELVRFNGFINYGTPITNGTQVLTENRILQPVFSTIRETVSVFVQDGSTLVIGGLLNELSQDVEDRTPFIGAVPGLGRLFKTNASSTQQTAIIFFVKARIIDPGGRPINTIGNQ
ncbi:MAG: Amuc_1098 family type IV pilus outer membrane protein [Verrucomicrobiota bacterium]